MAHATSCTSEDKGLRQDFEISYARTMDYDVDFTINLHNKEICPNYMKLSLNKLPRPKNVLQFYCFSARLVLVVMSVPDDASPPPAPACSRPLRVSVSPRAPVPVRDVL